MLRGPPGAGQILGADALVHARPVVVAGEEVAEQFVRLGLHALRQFVRSPGLAHEPARGLAIAGRKLHACQRQLAPRADRRIAREAANRGRIAALLPQPRLGAPSQLHNARPFRVGGEEGGIAGKIRRRLGVAQDVPFDELLPGRIGDPVPRRGRLVGLGLARKIDRFLHQRQIAGEGRCRLLGRRRILLRLFRFAFGVGMLCVRTFCNGCTAMRARFLRRRSRLCFFRLGLRLGLSFSFLRLAGRLWLGIGPRRQPLSRTGRSR